MVISALDTENGQKVAIKKITRAFDDLIDAKRILREITLLRKFSHDNVSALLQPTRIVADRSSAVSVSTCFLLTGAKDDLVDAGGCYLPQ